MKLKKKSVNEDFLHSELKINSYAKVPVETSTMADHLAGSDLWNSHHSHRQLDVHFQVDGWMKEWCMLKPP